GGARGPATAGPGGAMAGSEVVDAPTIGASGDGPGRRQASASSADGPAVGGLTSSGAPGKRAAMLALAGSAATVAPLPETGPLAAVAQADLDHLMGGAGDTPMTRQAGEALAVNVEAPAGPGGLGAEYTPEVGLNTRQSRQDSLQVQLRSARFLKSAVGGLPSISTTAIVSSEAFANRGARKQGNEPAGGKGSPPPQTEEAIERGLAFLARYQLSDGGWSLQGFPEEAQLATDTAATALSVLAFQGAGYNHREHQYEDVVRGGIDFLIKTQKENGDLFVPLDDDSNRSVWLYSHSLAAIALCEAYGMTQDPRLKEPAQKALDFIVAAQHPQRGGWRYSPGVGADTSVTGWMMMALKSGELAGLKAPQPTYRKIERWLDDAQHSPRQPHLYRYNPFAPVEAVTLPGGQQVSQRHGREVSDTMTAVGLMMRLYTGWQRDNPNMLRGADYLAEHLPALGTTRQPQRDTYYWYYGTQVMFHMGGRHWQAWNGRLHPMLVGTQIQQGPMAGSWDPQGAIPDRWGPHGGRLYVTTLNLLSLEVYYRHLPLYEDAAK
ncbi:MAG: prenyltransferase/squalene oxidase repeat-containing protein, partial [Pirellulaceae bacterium]